MHTHAQVEWTRGALISHLAAGPGGGGGGGSSALPPGVPGGPTYYEVAVGALTGRPSFGSVAVAALGFGALYGLLRCVPRSACMHVSMFRVWYEVCIYACVECMCLRVRVGFVCMCVCHVYVYVCLHICPYACCVSPLLFVRRRRCLQHEGGYPPYGQLQRLDDLARP